MNERTEYATVERRGKVTMRAMLDNARPRLSEARKLELLAAADFEDETTPRPRRGRSGLSVIADMERGRRLLAERRKAKTAGKPAPRLTVADHKLVALAVDEEMRFEKSLSTRR